MKILKILLLLLILIITIILFYKNPTDSKIIYDYSGLQVSQSSDKSITILKLDLTKVNIDFGGVQSDNILETPDSKLDRFNRLAAIETHKLAGKNKILAGINGQFFNAKKNPTILSFPVKSNNQIISSYVDNLLKKRTFIIGEDNIPMILSGYQIDNLENKQYRDLIVGINPEENFMKDTPLPRNFMGILDNQTLIFILATNKTQPDMIQLMYDQHVSESNIIMFDGGPSVQFALFDYSQEKPTVQAHYGRWAVPHFFIVSEK